MGGHPVKKAKTIFDLTMNNVEKEKIAMLLHRYNTEIFDPEDKELAVVNPDEIEILMRKTCNNYPFSQAKNKGFLRRKVLIYAASMFITCGLLFVILECNSKTGKLNNVGENTSPPSEQFRGFTPCIGGNTLTTVSSPKQIPLAYLVDVRGNITISRNQQQSFAPTFCEVLYQNDHIILAEDAKAKIMYEDAFFNVFGPKQYVITKPNPATVESNGETRQLEPELTTRGHAWGQANVPALVMPPRTLMVQVTTPITRAGESIPVYSPKGLSFSNTPAIKIGGDSNTTYVVSILDIENSVIGRSVEVKGKSLHQWSEFCSTPIVEDEIYSIRITHNGKIVNDNNDSSFWLLAKGQSTQISNIMKFLSSIEAESERLFLKANVLYWNGCYSEALLIMEKLQIPAKEKQLYENLLNRCKNELKIKE